MRAGERAVHVASSLSGAHGTRMAYLTGRECVDGSPCKVGKEEIMGKPTVTLPVRHNNGIHIYTVYHCIHIYPIIGQTPLHVRYTVYTCGVYLTGRGVCPIMGYICIQWYTVYVSPCCRYLTGRAGLCVCFTGLVAAVEQVCFRHITPYGIYPVDTPSIPAVYP